MISRLGKGVRYLKLAKDPLEGEAWMHDLDHVQHTVHRGDVALEPVTQVDILNLYNCRHYKMVFLLIYATALKINKKVCSNTLTATSSLSLVFALKTCARLAAAIGSGSNSANISRYRIRILKKYIIQSMKFPLLIHVWSNPDPHLLIVPKNTTLGEMRIRILSFTPKNTIGPIRR